MDNYLQLFLKKNENKNYKIKKICHQYSFYYRGVVSVSIYLDVERW